MGTPTDPTLPRDDADRPTSPDPAVDRSRPEVAVTAGRRRDTGGAHPPRDRRVVGRVVVVGGVIGMIEALLAISFGSLVFAGALSGQVGTGIGLALFGGAVILVTVALGSSLPNAMGTVQDVTAAVLAVVAAAIAAELGPDDPRLLGTVVVAIAIATATTASLLWVLGALRLGRLVRYVPYPVIGGFLAGTGWLLLIGGVGLLVGDLGQLTDPGAWSTTFAAKLALGLAVGVVLLAGVRRGAGPTFIPLGCIAVVVISYLIILPGPGVDAARAGGWLLGPFPDGRLWPPDLALLRDVDLTAIARQWLSILTVAGLSVVALLLNATGIELDDDTDEDGDLDQELRTTGIGNLVAALGGGLPGFHALSLSALVQRIGAPGRAVGLVAAGIIGLTLVFGTAVVAAMPTVLVGGLVIFLGLSFLIEWVIDSARELPRADHLVVLLILVVIAAVGFLEGVAVGLVAAVALFIRTVSRTPLVRREIRGDRYRSHVERPAAATRALQDLGRGITLLELQGALFFGTADRLLAAVRGWLDTEVDIARRLLVLDLQHVTSIDTSAGRALQRAATLADREGATLVLTGVPERLLGQLAADDEVALPVIADVDRALQWCEDQLLATVGDLEVVSPPSLRVRLTRELGSEQLADRLLTHLVSRAVPAGQVVLVQGERRRELCFVESGAVTVELIQTDGSRRRLSTMLAGTLVGEVGFALGRPRSATVVADTDTVVSSLTTDALERLERDDPELAAALHRLLARALAGRLATTLSTLEELGR
jgi:SulP family sulfate permease